MKITLRSVIAAVAMVGLTFSAQAQKIGYLNANAILADMPDMKSADSQLQAYAEQMNKLDSMKVVAFQGKIAVFQEQVQKGLIAPKQQAEEEAKLEAEKQALVKFEQEMSQDIQKRRADLYKPILDKVKAAIDKVSKANGYTYIVDATSGILLFASESGNIENLVRKDLGLPDAKPEQK